MSAGPFETSAEARALVHHVYAEARVSPRLGAMDAGNHELLCQTLAAAGVECGAFDHRVIRWLCQWEPETVAVLAGLISRAYLAGRRAGSAS